MIRACSSGRITASTLALLLAGAVAARAQVRGSLDVGAGARNADGATSTGLMSVESRLSWETRLTRFDAGAAYRDRERKGSAGEAWARASVFTPAAGPFRLQLLGAAAAGDDEIRPRGELEGGLRLHAYGRRGGLWVGTALGAAEARAGRTALSRAGTGGWVRIEGVSLQLSMEHTGFGERVGGQRSGDSLGVGADSTSRLYLADFTDVSAAASWRLSRLELGGGVSHRVGAQHTARTGWHLRGTWQLLPHLALVAEAGRYKSALPPLLPGGRYGHLSMRLSFAGRRGTGGTLLVPPVPIRREFAAARRRDGRVRIELAARDVSRVELSGDFTDWTPVALEPLGRDRWGVTLVVPPGLHRANVRYDGGPWRVPPSTTPETDEFGGAVGVFLVE